MRQETTESSIIVSLQELVALEGERVREEEQAREQARIAAEQARRTALAEQRAAEEARCLAEEARRAAEARQSQEQAARLKAIEEAELERARIQAATAAQLQVAEAQQHHERELLRIRTADGNKRLKTAGIVGLVVVLLGAGAATAGWISQVNEQRAASAAASARLQGERQRLIQQRLRDLDRMREQLRSEILQLDNVPAEVSAANAQVQQAEARASAGELRDADLDAYAQSLGTLAGTLPRAHRLDRLAQLDRLHKRLQDQLSAVRRKSPALDKAAARAAEERQGLQQDDPTDSSLKSLAASLETFTNALPAAAQPPASRPNTSPNRDTERVGETVCDSKYDPMCGLSAPL